jgi:serine/threonine-protein kinase
MNPRSDEPREGRGEASDVPREGDIIAGRYRVERVLGQGGMGVVVAARHTSLRQRVAVKFLRPAALKLPGASARFLREAQAAAAIHSEHVARVTDMGTLGTGSPFMVMEHLDGTDLSSVVKAKGPLSIKEAVDFVLQACEALAEAHKLGIVHRDLKPSNIFVTTHADGTPLIKVLDFGLSKVLDPDAAFAAESSLTETEMVVGSPHYMSPEHVRSLKYVDARTDIWSLGVILYQLLTARRPFDGDSLPSVFAKIVTEPPDSLRNVRPEVPPALEAAVLCCLEKDVNQRFQSVSEFARAIAPFGPETSRISAERIERVLPSLRTSGSSLPAVIAAEDPTTASVGTWARTKVRSRRAHGGRARGGRRGGPRRDHHGGAHPARARSRAGRRVESVPRDGGRGGHGGGGAHGHRSGGGSPRDGDGGRCDSDGGFGAAGRASAGLDGRRDEQRDPCRGAVARDGRSDDACDDEGSCC